MQKQQLALLFLALSIFSVCSAQTKTDSTKATPQPKWAYGVKINTISFLRLPNYSGGGKQNPDFGTDYTAYIQYRGFGVSGGYSALYNFTNGITYTNAVMNCFNLGVNYTFFQFNKTSALTLYFYNIHYSAANPFYQPAGYYNGMYHPLVYNKEIINFIIANPRYTATFCKGILSLELGIFFSAFKDHIFGGFNSNDNTYPAIGSNFSVTLNMAALFAKK
jgi:hypothetical protein